MPRKINKVAVLGLGNIGELVALMLNDSGFEVTGFSLPTVQSVEGTSQSDIEVLPLDVTDAEGLRTALHRFDVVVSCLPYARNVDVAEAAHDVGTHYLDLTEDIPTATRVFELSAQRPDLIFAPQCGLAPGFIAIVGASMARSFEQIRSIELKVGALPRSPTGRLGYAFNWSPEGVVNEYLNDCEVLRSGRRQMVPAMTDLEHVRIGGVDLEAALTSGGLGTMCQTYADRVQRLDYKTIRYPGHFDHMRFLFDELGLRSRPELALEILIEAKPPVNDDIVYLHAAVEGVKDGVRQRENYVRGYRPIEVAGRTWRAISWTTAASVVAVVELLADGRLPNKGFIRQEDVRLADLLSTNCGEYLDSGGRV